MTPSRPLVSIVTPTLQRRDLLERTLRSVRAQTYRPIEHIVVDGGSTDGTLELLADYAPTYDLRWVSEPDGGMYEAINKGLAMAKGEIVAYLNSDDLYFPWSVETAVRAFAADPGAGLVYGDAINVDAETGRIFLTFKPSFDLDYVRRVGFLVQPTVFWRHSVGLRFDESLRYVADCDAWMRVGATYRFAKVDEFLAIEQDHPGTIRASVAEALQAEITETRSRYVKMSGVGHRLRFVAGRLREIVLVRLMWLRFSVAFGRGDKSGPWAKLIATRRLQLSASTAFALQLLPRRLGGRVAELVMPDASWLDP